MNNTPLSVHDMNQIEHKMDSYIIQIEDGTRATLDNKISEEHQESLSSYIHMSYYNYLKEQYLTQLMLTYVNKGDDDLRQLIFKITDYEKDNITRSKNITELFETETFTI